MVKQTSWAAYQDIIRGGVAETQAEQVLQTINFLPSGISRAEISQALGMRINSVCGRVNELLAKEVIYVAEVSECSVTGRNVEKLKVIEYV
ncbi:MAG: hypothetical protein [Caudoviricetes sp.]|nr:MAG: hypothetical protein [Caudoviricetes sp.]